ncbi:MAG TPA: DUF5675 family protein [Vicinamibacterales bacterium]
MSALLLRRIKQNAYATYGRLDSFVTAELPWRDNAPDISCIPAGTYTAERYLSPDHGYVVFRLIDVPGRGYIELHIGCLPARDSKGCILLGSKFGDVDYADGKPNASGPGILGSKTAFHTFMLAHPEQRFTLTITDVPQ